MMLRKTGILGVLVSVIVVFCQDAGNAQVRPSVCPVGAELARTGDYDGALRAWRRSLSPGIEYKLWVRKAIQCLRQTGLAYSDEDVLAWYKRAHESGSLDGTVHYALLVAGGVSPGQQRAIREGLRLFRDAAERGSEQGQIYFESLDGYCREHPRECYEDTPSESPEN